MIIWINGAFGAGKTQTAFELNRRISNSFVYDPENMGLFIKSNIPLSIMKGDFQDYEVWREMNYTLIKYIEERSSETLIIPMTLVNPQYFNEIVGALRNKGIEVKHFALMASKETLLRRLKKRGDGANSWGAKQIDRCLMGLSNEIFSEHIETDNMSIEEVAEKIAFSTGINLLPDKTGRFRKRLSRLVTQLKHIRIFS